MDKARFFFTASGMAEDSFSVFSFSGDEAMDTGYRFEILLLSQNAEAENNLAGAKLRFGVRRSDSGEDDAVWHGIAESAAYLGDTGDLHCYRVVLVPRAAGLRHSTNIRIFMKLSLPGLIEDVLKKEGWTAGTDFDMRATETYGENPFVCQYNESAFAFMSRHMERQGMYSYIRQDGGGDCLVLADSTAGHDALPQGSTLVFEAPAGLVNPQAPRPEEVVFAFSRVLSRRPGKVRLLEHNTDTPAVNLDVQSDPVPPEEPQWGSVTLFGEDYDTPEEGRSLAKVLSESMACRAETFEGKSHIPYLRPGYTFTLTNHGRFQGGYLLVSVRHQGSRAAELGASLGIAAAGESGPDGYANAFTCIPAKTRYRAEIRTPRPKIHGVIGAAVDVAGDRQCVILDDQGRYTVKFFFDPHTRGFGGGGKDSIPLRMMQAHAGFESGIHFPLQNAVEVLVAFVGGNPDRPVILGALPNPEMPSPVKDKNQRVNIVSTPGGHRIVMDDGDKKTVRIIASGDASFIGIRKKPLPPPNGS